MPSTSGNQCHSSLEGAIDFSEAQTLTDDERVESTQRFLKITVHFETKQASSSTKTDFNRPLLVKLTYEYSQNRISQDGFLRVFFDAMAVPLRGDIASIDMGDPAVESDLEHKLIVFGDYLMDNFFMPLKACFGKTPQQSPASDSALARMQAGHEIVGTAGRLGELRRVCLERDRHRCVITRAFDRDELLARFQASGNNAVDDDGHAFPAGENYQILQVAHIIPHALVETRRNPDGVLDTTRETALKILDMFDSGVGHLVDGVEVDRPRNAITLSTTSHNDFGSFRIYFTPVDGGHGQEEHTYVIDAFLPPPLLQAWGFPIRRTLYTAPGIDPPSPRLLAIHRAIAHILHLSGAGDYIDRVFRDLGEVAVRADGTTPLASLVRVGLGGFLRGQV